jgi:hypothetical protein
MIVLVNFTTVSRINSRWNFFPAFLSCQIPKYLVGRLSTSLMVESPYVTFYCSLALIVRRDDFSGLALILVIV